MKKCALMAALALAGVMASSVTFAADLSGSKVIKSNLNSIVDCAAALESAVQVGAAADADLTATDLTVKACTGLLDTTPTTGSNVDANGVITLVIADSTSNNGISTAVGGSTFVLTPKTTGLVSYVTGSNTGDINSWAVAYTTNGVTDLNDVNQFGTNINYFSGLPGGFGTIS